MKFFNSVKALYSAVGILFITVAIGYYLDTKNDKMYVRHLEINLGLEKMVRLNQELASMLLLSVVEHNTLRTTRYNAVYNDSQDAISKIAGLTKEMVISQEITTLIESRDKIYALEETAIRLMRSDKWNDARDILFGDEYSVTKKTYEIDIETISDAILGEVAATEERFDRIKKVSLYIRISALLFLLWTGIMFSRRTRADLAEQVRLQTEISAANELLEERVLERTKEVESTMRKINAMSQAVNDALVMIDGEGKVLFWNEAAEKLFGYTVSEAMGMNFHEMAAPIEVREKAHEGVRQFSATGQGILFGAAIETAAVRRGGEILPVEVNLSPFQLDNKWFAVGTVRDITERKQADALKVGKEVAEEAAARAEKARLEAEHAQDELNAKVLEIERFNRLATGREHRIIDLKRQVNDLMTELGRNTPFQSPEQVEEQALDNMPVAEAQTTLGAAEIKREFIELLQKNALHELFTHFCNVAGVPAAIIDLDANVLASSPWQRACTDFHRVNKTSCARCIESDTNLALKLIEGKDYAIYRCRNGMTDCASPIIINGHHIANVFIGQFHLAEPDDGFFAKQADELGFDRSEYLKAVHEAPVMDEARLPNILGFLSRFAKLIGSFAVEQWRARQAELNIRKHALTVQMERAAAMNLAEDANEARLEVERFKEHLELLVSERTEELHTAEERSRLILASVNEGIFGLDTEGRVMFANLAANTTLGYTEEDMLGKLIHAEVHYAYPDGSKYPVARCPMYLSSQDGKSRTIDNEVLWRKDGKAVPVEYTTTPVLKDDRVVGAVVSFRDITERKQSENELKERMEELERFSRLTINREEKMIQLKEEINILLGQMGREKKYKIV